ncbi:MAG: hypothetical protein ABF242_05545 [Flavobacteriales bacterium]
MKHLISIILILSIVTIKSQTFEWGETFDSKTTIEKIIGTDGGLVYAHSSRMKKNYIDTYDKNLNLTKSRLITLKKKSVVVDVFMANGELNILNYIHDKEEDEIRLYANFADKNGITKNDDKLIMIIPLESSRMNGKFSFEFSPDKSKILFHHEVLLSKIGVTQLTIKMVDNQFNELVSNKKTFKTENKKRVKTSFEFAVNNQGGYYLLSGINSTRNGKINSQTYNLFCYDKTGSETKKKEISFENKYIANSKLKITEDGKTLICGGVYMEIPANRKGKSYSVDHLNGVWSHAMNTADNSILFSTTNDFDTEFYREYYSEKKFNRKKDKEEGLNISSASTPVIKNIIAHSKGFYIVSEQFSNSLDDFPGAASYQLTHGHIFVTSISEAGTLNWHNSVFKNQIYNESRNTGFGAVGLRVRSANGRTDPFFITDGYTSKEVQEKTKFYSFLTTTKDDDLKILYLDTYRNDGITNSDDISTMRNYRKGIPYVVTISQGGDLNKKGLAKDKDEVFIAPKMYFVNDKKEFIIYGEKRKDKKLSYFSF